MNVSENDIKGDVELVIDDTIIEREQDITQLSPTNLFYPRTLIMCHQSPEHSFVMV